jgi:hypothetical protein
MKTVTQVCKAMQPLLIDKANELAIETGFMERERVLTGSSFVVGLMSGWQANPQASLDGLSQAIGNAGTPITRQGLAYRFDESAVVFAKAMLKASLEVAITTMPISSGILSHFTSVDLVDSSIVTLPNHLKSIWRGSGGFGENASVSAVKLNVRLDVKNGHLKTLDLSDGTQHDRSSVAHHQAVEAGSLQIADLGYFKLDDFEAIEGQNAYWLSRYKLGTKVYDTEGKSLDLPIWLPQRIGKTIDCKVLLGKEKQLPCRLVAERVPPQVVRQRHERIQETARKKGTPVSQQALDMAHWTIYVTNISPQLTPKEIFILGRYRWQIELLFKLWKSDLQIDKWASSNPHRILCELYTKLTGAIVTHWFLLVACWHNPQRSFRLAIPTIQGLAWQFANSLHNLHLLRHAFERLCGALSKTKMGKSRTDPRSWQLIYENIA